MLWRDSMNGWITVLVVGVLILLATGAASQEESKCSDIKSFPKVSGDNELFKSLGIDKNTFDIHKITSEPSLTGEICITMKIPRDDTDFTFFWTKDGEKYTDLDFYYPGGDISFNNDSPNPGSFGVKKDQEVKWIFRVRDNGPNKHNAFIAIPSQSSLPVVEDTNTSEMRSGEGCPAVIPRGTAPDKTDYNEIEVNGGNLQDWINNCSGPTKLSLMDQIFTIDEPIKIENMNHLTIESKIKPGAQLNYVDSDGHNRDTMIIINNSTYITLFGINMKSQDSGLKINHSNNCNIIHSVIGFNCYGYYGIFVDNSSWNINITDNLIYPLKIKNSILPEGETTTTVETSNMKNDGIKISNGTKIYAENNEIKDNGIETIAYSVADGDLAKDVTIIPYWNNNCDNKPFNIKYGSCNGLWSCNDGIYDGRDSISQDPCRILGNNDNKRVWTI